MTSFPSSIASLTNPGATQLMNAPSHSTIETNQNNEISAIETKVGVDSSSVVTSIDYLLKNTSSIDPGHKHSISSITNLPPSTSYVFTAGEAITGLDAVAYPVGTIAVTAISSVAGVGTNLTIPHVCSTSGALITGVWSGNNTIGATATYGGVPMSAVKVVNEPVGTNTLTLLFLANASAGTNNLIVNNGGSNTAVVSVSYTGVGAVRSGGIVNNSSYSIPLSTNILNQGAWMGAVAFNQVPAIPAQMTSLLGVRRTTVIGNADGAISDSAAIVNDTASMAYTVTTGNNIGIGYEIIPSLTTTSIKRSTANATVFNKFVGIAPSSIPNGNSGVVTTSGIVTGLVGLLPGQYYYQSSVAGGITPSGGFKPIGVALSTTDLLLFRN